MARLKITVDEFYDMTPLEVDLALREHMEWEQSRLERGTRDAFEAARYVAMNVWNSQGRYLPHELKHPTQLITFPWDEEAGVGERKKQSTEEIKAIMMNVAGSVNKKHERKSKKNVKSG